MLLADVEHLRRSLDALLDNALKHSPAGSNVRVVVAPTNKSNGEKSDFPSASSLTHTDAPVDMAMELRRAKRSGCKGEELWVEPAGVSISVVDQGPGLSQVWF